MREDASTFTSDLLLDVTMLLLVKVCLMFSCFSGFIEANPQHSPRMIFTEKDAAVKRLPLPAQRAPVRIFLEEQLGTVTAAGQTSLNLFNFQDRMKTPVEKKVVWEECKDKVCNYTINIIHKMEETNHLFLCGNNGTKTMCCEMDLSTQTSICIPSEKTKHIQDSINGLKIKEGEPSAFVESARGADLYVAYSGSKDYVGIHKFGENRVRPGNHAKEQHYVSLMPIRQGGNPNQDKVYAFYKEKNRETKLGSEMWLPFVTRICMADVGGPKNNLQFSWTSQMNARLFCGDPERKQYFSELADVATVQADQWEDTRVYALFRNEWGMSAVCVYTMGNIEKIFNDSPFKGASAENKDRLRMCVVDSKKISLDNLRKIEQTSEMEEWVKPEGTAGPLLFNHQNYTHIYVDSSQHKRNETHTVLFLSLNDGGIHKVMHNKDQTIVIAEYRPFNHQAHIFSMTLHPFRRKIYVSSGSELAQLDVENCAQYGDRCEECILSRDPYCGWNGTYCSPQRNDTMQNVIEGNYASCPQAVGKAFRYSTNGRADKDVESIVLPAESRYFFQCPVSSHHARYTWHHGGSSTSCSPKEQNCLFLIDSMGPEQEGTYKCSSEERGFTKVLAQYNVEMTNGASGRSSGPLVWVCLMVVLIKSLNC